MKNRLRNKKMLSQPTALWTAVEKQSLHTAALCKNMLLNSWPAAPLLWPCSLPYRGWQALQLSAHSCSQAERRPIHKPSAKHPAPCPLLYTPSAGWVNPLPTSVRRTRPAQRAVYLSKVGLNAHFLRLWGLLPHQPNVISPPAVWFVCEYTWEQVLLSKRVQ